LVQQDVATFFAQAELETSADSRRLVKKGFATFVVFGILAHGSLRQRLLPPGQATRFRMQAAWFLPLLPARRVSQSAWHLVGQIVLHFTVQQRVLPLPSPPCMR
jgi:hypothetical protein